MVRDVKGTASFYLGLAAAAIAILSPVIVGIVLITKLDERTEQLKESIESTKATLSKTSDSVSSIDRKLGDLTGRVERAGQRVDEIQPKIESVYDHLSSGTIDTLYVFKHIFDFPNPSIYVTEEEARRALCEDFDQPALGRRNLDLKAFHLWLYRRQLEIFDFSADFTFYTMVSDPENTVRYGMACFRHDFENREEVRTSNVPFRVALTEIEGRPPRYLINHDTVIPGPVPLMRGDGRRKEERHRLAVTIQPDGLDRGCPDYLLSIAKNDLDRCIFEAAIFAPDATSDVRSN